MNESIALRQCDTHLHSDSDRRRLAWPNQLSGTQGKHSRVVHNRARLQSQALGTIEFKGEITQTSPLWRCRKLESPDWTSDKSLGVKRRSDPPVEALTAMVSTPHRGKLLYA